MLAGGRTGMNAERGGLLVSMGVAALMAALGIGFALATNSRAILLDGLFNLTYSAFAVVTLRVAHLVTQPDNAKFPFGHGYFESLVNAGKGLLILGISLAALVDSLMALLGGGRSVAPGLAVLYAVLATAICSVTAWRLHRVQRQSNSPLLHADAQNWLLDAIISATVLAAFSLVFLLDAVGLPAAVPYVDPVLVAAVTLFCLGVPVRMAGQAIAELLNRAPPPRVAEPVTLAIDGVLETLPVRHRYIRMVRPGRTLYVAIHIVLSEDFAVERLATLDRLRDALDGAVRAAHPLVVVDAFFTAEPRWAAPNSGLRTPGN